MLPVDPAAAISDVPIALVDQILILVRNEKPFDPWDPDIYFRVITKTQSWTFGYDDKTAFVAFLKKFETSLSTGEPPLQWSQIAAAEQGVDTEAFEMWKRR